MGKKRFVAQEYSTATNGRGLEEGTAVGRFFTRFTIVSSIIGIMASVAIVAFTLIFLLSPVNGTSMMTTINATGKNTDSVLTNKIAGPGRGDIIVTKLYSKDTANGPNYVFPSKNADAIGNFDYIIKRLIALPGDTIEVRREAIPGGNQNKRTPPYAAYHIDASYNDYTYSIYVNGVRLNENYLNAQVSDSSALNFQILYRAVTEGVPSSDWRATDLSAIRTTNVDGVNFQNPYITVPAGYWFFMGDNRGGDNKFNYSWDCSWLGPQKMEYYIGRGDDILPNGESIISYLWRKFSYYVLFGWTADL